MAKKEAPIDPHAAHRAAADLAAADGSPLRVAFNLDDGTPRTWDVSVGEIDKAGFWTKGRFYIAFDKITALPGTVTTT